MKNKRIPRKYAPNEFYAVNDHYMLTIPKDVIDRIDKLRKNPDYPEEIKLARMNRVLLLKALEAMEK